MNVANKLKVGMYMRLLEGMTKHFRRADNRDVKDALDVMEFRRNQGAWWEKGWKKEKVTKYSLGIPKSWAFSPAMSKLGLETMSEEEKKSFITAYRRTFPKLST